MSAERQRRWDQEWLIFRLSDHRWMGSLSLPADQEAVHIGEEHVVSIGTTELGEEFLQLRGIDRMGRAGSGC